jgi:NAD(P)-dependent dehydrogenase (short-subunit alcohol dehydrogenase family)
MTEVRTYVVTGTSGLLAGALRRRLEGQGHRVVGVDVDASADVVADLSSADGRDRMLREVETSTDGRIDAVVAAAAMVGVFPDTPRMVRTNYFGVLATLEGLRPMLARSPAPRAATFASVSLLHRPIPGLVEACLDGDEDAAAAVAAAADDQPAVYTTTKRALARWLRRRAVSADWAGNRIPLNAVAPGMTRHDDFDWQPDSRFGRFMRELEPRPLHPVSRLDDVASLVDWLTSVDNGAMTGQILFVDGGTEAVLRGDDLWPGFWPDPHPSAPMPDIKRS